MYNRIIKCERVFIMKKIISIVLAITMLLLVFSLTGCGYRSSGVGTMMITSSKSNSASLKFYVFEGTKAFNLKITNKNEGTLKYHAEVLVGSATVYYDINGTKQELCKVSAGDVIESSIDFSEKGKLWIIIETSEKCYDGDFSFTIE